MCEMIVCDPDRLDHEQQVEWAADATTVHRDGLGFVAAYPDGDRWAYETYVAVAFDRDDVDAWLADQQNARRIIGHARMATSGGRGVDEAHPLAIECDECDAELVCHNGIVYEGGKYDPLIRDGHTYTTGVDSETIAHAHGSMATDVDDVTIPDLSGQLHYVLCGERSIIVRTEHAYAHFGDGTIARCSRLVSDDCDTDPKLSVIRPDGTDTRRYTPPETDVRAAVTGSCDMCGASVSSLTLIGGSWMCRECAGRGGSS